MPLIETKNITKIYGSAKLNKSKVQALTDFTFSVNEGEIFGLLGPNGAGKTTLIKILLAITFPTTGTGTIFGKPLTDSKWKSKVGYLPENHKFPLYLTGEQVLTFYGRLSGLKNKIELDKKITALLETMQLTQWKKTKIKKYSKGMMQKLGLAQALLNEPDLLFLDEPTDGVDPIGRKEIRDLLVDLKNKGKTIFVNSHLLSEVEMICDRVAILNKGDLIKEGNVDDLTRVGDVYEIETVDVLSNELKQKILSIDQKAGIGNTEIHAEIHINKLNEIIDILRNSGIMIKTVRQKQSSLEEYFINVIQKDNA